MGASKAWSFQNNQRSIHISNPLSLSLKNLKKKNQKSSKLELTFCWKLIGVSDEGWSRGARTRPGARIWGFWWFGGFEDWGFWSFYLTIETWSSAKIQICWGFHSSCYSRFGGFHFQKWVVEREVTDAITFFMLISKVFMAVEIAWLKKCMLRRSRSKKVSDISLFQRFY